jgi:hypothetical protein
VVIKYRLVQLVASDAHLLGVDHHDIVPAIHMRRELGLVLAAQTVGDDDGQAAQDHPSASISTQSFFTSAGLMEGVLLSMSAPLNGKARLIAVQARAVKRFLLWYHNTTATAGPIPLTWTVPIPAISAEGLFQPDVIDR